MTEPHPDAEFTDALVEQARVRLARAVAAGAGAPAQAALHALTSPVVVDDDKTPSPEAATRPSQSKSKGK